MKRIISLALFLLIFSSLTLTANAGTVTTTTTTVTTVKKTSCHAYHKHYKKHRRHHCYGRRCYVYGYYYYDDGWGSCGSYDCYYDLNGGNYRQTYLPVTYDHQSQYDCLASDDPASCS